MAQVVATDIIHYAELSGFPDLTHQQLKQVFKLDNYAATSPLSESVRHSAQTGDQ